MATQTTTIIRDDLTGAEISAADAKTATLTFGAESWELDLTLASFRKIREMLEPIVVGARRATPAKPTRAAKNGRGPAFQRHGGAKIK